MPSRPPWPACRISPSLTSEPVNASQVCHAYIQQALLSVQPFLHDCQSVKAASMSNHPSCLFRHALDAAGLQSLLNLASFMQRPPQGLNRSESFILVMAAMGLVSHANQVNCLQVFWLLFSQACTINHLQTHHSHPCPLSSIWKQIHKQTVNVSVSRGRSPT